MSRYESNSNYYNDRRVRGSERRWWEHINERSMKATVFLPDDNGDDDEVEVPIKFEVCGTCRGKGSHVNPSVDCDGLTDEDFYEDPDFAAEYMCGLYDVTCYECEGQKVVPVIDEDYVDPTILEQIRRKHQTDAEYLAERRAERRMGA